MQEHPVGREGARVTTLPRGERALVMIHASGSGATSLSSLGAQLAQDYSLYIPNLFGYGDRRKDGDASPADPIANHLGLVSETMDTINGKSVILLGHSMGGFLALKTAAQRPDQVSGVIAIEPMCYGALDLDRDAEFIAMDRALIEKLRSAPGSEGVTAFISFWNGLKLEDMNPGTQAKIHSLSAHIIREAVAVSHDSTDIATYQKLACPVMLLKGAETNPIASRIVDVLSRANPNWATATIPGAGHMLPVTHPGDTAAAIRKFLQNIYEKEVVCR